MASPNQQQIEVISTKILFDAKEAIKMIKMWNTEIKNSADKVAQLKALISATAKQMDGDIRGVTQAVSSFSKALETNPTMIRNIGKELQNLQPAVNSASNSFSSMINVVKGAITAMLTLAALRIVKQFFSDALKAAEEFRGKLAELNFAESILSKKGMDITRAEFDKMISDLTAKTKYLSVKDTTGIVADVANMGAEFNIAKKDIIGLSEAVAFMQLQEKAFRQEMSDSTSIINAALDGRSNYFNKYGINITKTAIKEKAYAMGLAEVGSQITKEVSNQAAIALLIEQTAGKFDELFASIEKVNPALANQLLITKKTNEANLEIGDALLKTKDAWNEFVSALIKSGDFDEMVDSVVVLINALTDFVTLLKNGKDTYDLLSESADNAKGKLSEFGNSVGNWLGFFQNFLTLLQLVFLGFTTIAGAIVTTMGIASEFFAYITGKKSYEEAGAAIGVHFANGLFKGITIGLKPLVSGKDDPISNSLRSTMETLENVIGLVNEKINSSLEDTPTAPFDNGDLQENEELLSEIEDKVKDIAAEAQKAREELDVLKSQKEADLEIKVRLKSEDIELEYKRKAEDAARDLVKKIEDINRDSAKRAAEEKEKARINELQAELELAQKLKELRQQFLFDLEDALHARDARQVLRLIRNYNAEREKLLEREDFEKQLRAMRLQNELRAIEAERRAKIASAKLEYQQKLEDLAIAKKREYEELAIWKQREYEDIQRWYAREQEEIRRNSEYKIRQLLDEYIKSGKITDAGMKNILTIIAKYVNLSKAQFADLSNYANSQLSKIQGAMIITPTKSTYTGVSGGGGGGGGGMKMAEGGTLIANKPTNVLFGEAGLEMATFTPLERKGADVGKIFGNLTGSEAGSAVIQVTLSPDLEARVVENALGQTAKVIVNTMRGIR